MKVYIILFGLFHVGLFLGSCIGLLFLPIPQEGLASTPGNVTYTWLGQNYVCLGQGNATTVYIQLIHPTECLAHSNLWDYGKAFWFGLFIILIYAVGSCVVLVLTWKHYHRPTSVRRIHIPAVTEISVISEKLPTPRSRSSVAEM